MKAINAELIAKLHALENQVKDILKMIDDMQDVPGTFQISDSIKPPQPEPAEEPGDVDESTGNSE
jgi:hypothetical protein